jgi:hypothetical protein
MTTNLSDEEISKLANMSFDEFWEEYISVSNERYNNEIKKYSFFIRIFMPKKLTYSEKEKILAELFYQKGRLNEVSSILMKNDKK